MPLPLLLGGQGTGAVSGADNISRSAAWGREGSMRSGDESQEEEAIRRRAAASLPLLSALAWPGLAGPPS